MTALALLLGAVLAQDAGPVGRLVARTLTTLPERTAALAAGDLTGDGKPELVVALADAVLVLDADGKVLGRAELMGEPARHPVREPFALLELSAAAPQVRLLSGSRELLQLVTLDAGGLSVATAPRASVRSGGPRGRVTIEPLPGAALFRLGAGGASWVAVSFHGPLQLRVAGEGRAELSPPAAFALPTVGAGSTLADLDGDGVSELFASEPARFPAAESVRVVATQDGAVRSSLAATGRILQAAAEDIDGDRRDEVVTASWMPDGTTTLARYDWETP